MIPVFFRSIFVASIIGLLFTTIAAMYLPTYEQHHVETGYLVLHGFEALKLMIQQSETNLALLWLTGYFAAFFIPTFLGAIWQGIWCRKI